VDYAYTINGSDLPQAATAALYWSSDTSFDPSGPNQDTLAYSTTTQTAQSQTPYSVHVDPSQFTAVPPVGTKYLLVVINPPGANHIPESDETNGNDPNNIQFVAYDPIAAISATSPDSRDLTFTYDVTEAGLAQPFDVAVYRSSSSTFDPTTAIQVPVGHDITIPSQDTSNQPSVGLGPHTVVLNDPDALHPDPGHEYVFVVADPMHVWGDPSNTVHESHFRKFVLGVVAHGLLLNGQVSGVPLWETQMASDLVFKNSYDLAIPFDWSNTSNLPFSGMATAAGDRLSQQIISDADALVQRLGSPGDVVDLHLIGHSRGAVVISQALQDLDEVNITTDPVIIGGFKIMTMLDPHPANNGFASPDYSAAGNFFASFLLQKYQKMQAAMQDPQVIIPPNVDEAEEYYQHTPVSMFSGVYSSQAEAFLNLWGEDPSLIKNKSQATLQVHPLTSVVDRALGPIGHSEVPLFYVLYELPLEKNKGYGSSGG